MRRVVIVGCPGNGKSTLAGRLARALDVPHIELDGLFHVTDWESATDDEFRRDLVAALDAAPDGWVTCGNYFAKADDLHIARADTVVWLDLPRVTVTWRTLRRTVRRAVRREPLFGNDLREPWTGFLRWDPAHNITRWAWVQHPRYRRTIPERLASPGWRHLAVHHLTTPAAIAEFRAEVEAGQG